MDKNQLNHHLAVAARFVSCLLVVVVYLNFSDWLQIELEIQTQSLSQLSCAETNLTLRQMELEKKNAKNDKIKEYGSTKRKVELLQKKLEQIKGKQIEKDEKHERLDQQLELLQKRVESAITNLEQVKQSSDPNWILNR